MRVLVLGGTGFLGGHLVESLLADGHEPTLFHRGRTGPDRFPRVEHLLGDRDGGLALPRGRTWDAAIDTCGYVPRVVGANARALAGRVGRLAFVSSISVYADVSKDGLDESGALKTLADPTVEEVTPATYGGLKALCERAVAEAFPDTHLVVRPGLIAGPGDPSDRFTYWVWRLARGGAVLAPAPPTAPVQWIDARDLAAWLVRLVARGAGGTIHAAGPASPATLGDVLEACRVPGVRAELVWADGELLVSQGALPWGDLPLWTHVPSLRGAQTVDLSRALGSGLRLRPLEETVLDVRAFAAARGDDHTWRAGLSPAREERLLRAWHAWSGARPASGARSLPGPPDGPTLPAR